MNKFDVKALSVNELSISEMEAVNGGGIIADAVEALGKVFDELGDAYHAVADFLKTIGV